MDQYAIEILTKIKAQSAVPQSDVKTLGYDLSDNKFISTFLSLQDNGYVTSQYSVLEIGGDGLASWSLGIPLQITPSGDRALARAKVTAT